MNNIKSLTDFAYCKNLHELYIRRNMITDLSELQYLRELPKLKVLWLADNPCSAVDNYRQTVINTLPQLTKLDNMTITREEKEASSTDGSSCTLKSSKSYENTMVYRASSLGELREVEHKAFVECEIYTGKNEAAREKRRVRIAKQKSDTAVTDSCKANNNILSATLCLIKELDKECLDIVADAIKNRLESITECENVCRFSNEVGLLSPPEELKSSGTCDSPSPCEGVVDPSSTSSSLSTSEAIPESPSPEVMPLHEGDAPIQMSVSAIRRKSG